MPAPDLGPPPPSHALERPLAVHLLPALVPAAALAGGVVIVIDALRASVTISAAIRAGARCIIPVLTVDDALQARTRLVAGGTKQDQIVLGGERGGVLIPGFDLDNSPLSYTAERVRSRVVVFTTANGTAAMLHAANAARVLVGSITNLSRVAGSVASDGRPVHILCSGTRGEITLDDCIAAGALTEQFLAAGRQMVSDDSALVCLQAWKRAKAEGIEKLFAESRGGRNLLRLGFGPDLALCATIDAIPVLPEYSPARGDLRDCD
ncbi:MAG: 2-phosphosulfolactate phosphatase [Phycisphaerales bacterium]|nr:2-phosphosulfolactate phosphatase [Planctomycetota bacterium]